MQGATVDLKRDERAVFDLRSLYCRYGYHPYKMSKFEEYDLYVRNKDFLISDHIITFTDSSGRLLALKPDVTLSIVKNTKDEPDGVQKVYYNENVYRVSPGSHDFREITQVGLECIGQIDTYQLCEVLTLAAASLYMLSSDVVLELSHLDIVSRVLDTMGVSDSTRAALLVCIAEKNAHDVDALCRAEVVSEQKIELLKQLIRTCGNVDEVLPVLSTLAKNDEYIDAARQQLCRVIEALQNHMPRERLRIDFSLINDMSYYNGVVFRGYIKGVPTGILSGGQYDGLMQKMGKRSRAVGFAVYLDLLEGLSGPPAEYDVDTVVLYDQKTDVCALTAVVARIGEAGERVSALQSVPQGLRYRRLLKMTERGVVDVE